MACGKVSFFFFGYSGLSLKSCSQHLISSKLSSKIALLLSNVLANCISRVSPLLPWFVFSKATTSLRRPGKHSGQPCQWQPWNWNTAFVSQQRPSTGYPAILLSPPWPHIWWWICTPLHWPRISSSWPPFPHTPCGRRTLFRNQFQAARFALLDTPPLVQTSACRRKWHALVNLAWHSAHA